MRVIPIILALSLMPCSWGQTPGHDLANRLSFYTPESVKLAVENRGATTPGAPELLAMMQEWEAKKAALTPKLQAGDAAAMDEARALLKQVDAFFLSNPLIKGKNVLAIKRKTYTDQNNPKTGRTATSGWLGVAPSNFQNNSEIGNPKAGWPSEFVVLVPAEQGEITTKTLYKPEQEGMILSDPEVHWDGERIMYSSIGTNDRWHLFELNSKTGETKQITPEEYKDFDSFSGTYTPGGKIIFCSTGTFLGLPCTSGHNKMSGIFQYDPETKKTRQLTFDQDSNWDPVVMNDGKILYQRWEYADLPHSNSRFLFTMNPDGTTQQIYYGSGSYFPASFFSARPIPGHPTAVVGIATGHHSVSRHGFMMIIDPKKGLYEAEGIVTQIPFRGRPIEANPRDPLPNGIWPHFMHPCPLDENYFIVTMKNDQNALWGLYLVDVYDNRTLIAEEDDYAFVEPLLLEKSKEPQVIPERVNMESETSTIFVQDVYEGEGLKGIPRGTVKKLRIGTYSFSPWAQGGCPGSIGMDGPWDVKLIMGTVDVEEDGSAMFTAPANIPIFVQPLDAEGKALQVMRTWFTAMPGEKLSCVGCHEDKSELPVPKANVASNKKPQEIQPWYGPIRGFDFKDEVQPVLDKHCIECHNPSKPDLLNFDGKEMITDWKTKFPGTAEPGWGDGGKFSRSYVNLQRYVRRPGIESDMKTLTPMDVHADQTELFQMLNKGHHGVKLDSQSIERLACWIDLNAPFHGRRSEMAQYDWAKPSIELKEKYREMFQAPKRNLEFKSDMPVTIEAEPRSQEQKEVGLTNLKKWPLAEPEKMINWERKGIDFGHGFRMNFVRVPAGTFIMGSDRLEDEKPQSKVTIDKPFWVATMEVTNGQFRHFNPDHSSRTEHRHSLQFGRKGWDLDQPEQPVVRVSWKEAMEFCAWLSEKTGLKVSLPTEAQWEWACRAGSDTPYSFGRLGDDFTAFANLGDLKLKEFCTHTVAAGYDAEELIKEPTEYDDRLPHDEKYNDGSFVSVNGGKYRPNAWGLYDMHGNVAEWTLSAYKPYPYQAKDGRNDVKASAERVVRGGSWFDRPFRGTSTFRIPYRDYQKVYNVGFRVVINE